MPDDHTKAPTTIKEVGIHIGYMREDLTDLKKVVESFTESAATKAELAALNKRVDSLERKRWIQNTLSAILGAVLAILIGFFFQNIGKQ